MSSVLAFIGALVTLSTEAVALGAQASRLYAFPIVIFRSHAGETPALPGAREKCRFLDTFFGGVLAFVA